MASTQLAVALAGVPWQSSQSVCTSMIRILPHLHTTITCLALAGCLRSLHAQEFDREVAPILARHCLECHYGSDAKGELDLSNQASALAGGESGPVIEPGKVDESLLWKYVQDETMPPEEPLSDEEKAVLKIWIAEGATWGTDPIDRFRFDSDTRAGYDWWSLQPVVRPTRPVVDRADWPREEIDFFVLQGLEAAGLEPSPEADRRTLVRRLYFDLHGLPPSPDEVNQFVADPDSRAYEQLVDRLLASPHYGERWARHWLDVARFGESDGFEYDTPRPNAWRYRDWVIAALNQDMPYDEFARLQLAGDLLRPNDDAAIVATGFLVCGSYDVLIPQGDKMKQIMRQDELDDLVSVVSQTFLGLTVNCARCHDHKFDPIRQTEYYRLASALSGVHRSDRDLSHDPETTGRIAKLQAELDALIDVADSDLLTVPDPTSAQDTPIGKLRQQIKRIRKAFAVTPEEAPVVRLLARGSPFQPGEAVAAGGVEAIQGVSADFGLKVDAPESERRKKLAAWITDPHNPLFARTIVNRIWHYHFGAGLVETPSDLGFNGRVPSHAAMLDLLATELAAHGWSLKQLHRTILFSATYRQDSEFRSAAQVDAGNRLLWRKSPVRLEAEVVRDAILQISGQLNPAMGGPGFEDFEKRMHGGTWHYDSVDREGPQYNRRTIYRTWARGGRDPMLDAFDCPDPSVTAPKRGVTTTPLQALVLLNHPLMLRMSDHFSERLVREAGPRVQHQIEHAYRLAFGREASPDEVQEASALVHQHGLPALCRVLLNANEFLYVR